MSKAFLTIIDTKRPKILKPTRTVSANEDGGNTIEAFGSDDDVHRNYMAGKYEKVSPRLIRQSKRSPRVHMDITNQLLQRLSTRPKQRDINAL